MQCNCLLPRRVDCKHLGFPNGCYYLEEPPMPRGVYQRKPKPKRRSSANPAIQAINLAIRDLKAKIQQLRNIKKEL